MRKVGKSSKSLKKFDKSKEASPSKSSKLFTKKKKK